MEKLSALLEADLNAAMPSQDRELWSDLWSKAQKPRLEHSDWVLIAFMGLCLALQVATAVFYPPARARLVQVLPLADLLLPLAIVAFGLYRNRKVKQVRALQELLQHALRARANQG